MTSNGSVHRRVVGLRKPGANGGASLVQGHRRPPVDPRADRAGRSTALPARAHQPHLLRVHGGQRGGEPGTGAGGRGAGEFPGGAVRRPQPRRHHVPVPGGSRDIPRGGGQRRAHPGHAGGHRDDYRLLPAEVGAGGRGHARLRREPARRPGRRRRPGLQGACGTLRFFGTAGGNLPYSRGTGRGARFPADRHPPPGRRR